MAMDNHVVAYGMDENGDLFPLSASNVASLQAYRSLERRWGQLAQLDVGVAGSVVIGLPASANGKNIFVHGVKIVASNNSSGTEPIGYGGSSGMFDDIYAPGLHFELGSGQTEPIDGFLGDLFMITESKPSEGTITASNGVYFSNGYMDLGAVIKNYSPGDIEALVDGGGTGGFMWFRVIYSVLE